MQLKDSIKLTPFKCAVIKCLLTYLSLALIHLFPVLQQNSNTISYIQSSATIPFLRHTDEKGLPNIKDVEPVTSIEIILVGHLNLLPVFTSWERRCRLE